MSRPPPVLGPFTLSRVIGRGGMGQVWAGVHRAQDLPVAVKFITGTRARASRYQSAFRNEVRAMARLDHPGIVTVLDYGEVTSEEAAAIEDIAPGSPYLVMEHVVGGSLARVATVTSWRSLRAVLLALLDALAHAHARGVIHRDLKPDNVLVAGSARRARVLKLTDFGIARAIEEVESGAIEDGDDERRPSLVGTPAYMAPEQIRGIWQEQGPWTDLYSLGCLAYRLGTGHTPFTGEAKTVLRGHVYKPAPPFPEERGFPAAFSTWLARLLAKSPGERYQLAADAAFALHAIEAPQEPAAEDAAGDAGEGSDGAAPPEMGHGHAGGMSLDLDASDTSVAPVEFWSRVSMIRPETAPTATALLADGEPGSLVPSPETQGHESGPRIRVVRAVVPPTPTSWRRSEEMRLPMALVGAGLGLYGLRPTPFVGRERERDEIWNALRAAESTGRAQVVLLRGSAGYGKSRLAEWVAQRAHEVGAAVVLRASHSPVSNATEGIARMVASALRCIGMSQSAMYKRVCTVWQRRVGHDPDDYIARAMLELMSPLARERDPERAHVLEFASPTERYAAVYQFLELACSERAVFLWLDDLQWSADTIGLIAHVLARQARRPRPLLVLGTVRDEAVESDSLAARALAELVSRADVNTLDIGPLSVPQQARLVELLLRMDGDLVTAVCERTAGNPLFAVQLVGDWVERGVLHAGESGFSLAPGESTTIPNDIHLVWSARVRQLVDRFAGPDSERARQALEMAATLGRTVETREWQRACALAEIEIPAGLLESLLANQLAQSVTHDAEGWSFAHGMLRESIEREAVESGRAPAYARACARMLEERYDLEHPGMAERLVQYLMTAGESEQATEHIPRVIRQYTVSGDCQTALQWLERSESLLRELDVADADPRRVRALIGRARVLAMQGMLGACAECIAEARARAQERGHSRLLGEIEYLDGQRGNKVGDIDGALRCYQASRQRYQAIDDADGVALAVYGMGEIRKMRGELDQAASHYLAAIERFEESGDGARLGTALSGLSDTYRRMGDHARALEVSARALAQLHRLGRMHDVGIALNDRGDIYRYIGDLERAERHYRKAVELFEAQGSGDHAFARINLAFALLERGEFHEAMDIIAHAEAEFTAQQRTGYLAFAYALMLPCLAATEAWPRFDEYLERAAQGSESARLIDEDLARPLTMAANICRERDQPHRALAVYRLALFQWQSLARDERIAEITEWLEALEPASAS